MTRERYERAKAARERLTAEFLTPLHLAWGDMVAHPDDAAAAGRCRAASERYAEALAAWQREYGADFPLRPEDVTTAAQLECWLADQTGQLLNAARYVAREWNDPSRLAQDIVTSAYAAAARLGIERPGAIDAAPPGPISCADAVARMERLRALVGRAVVTDGAYPARWYTAKTNVTSDNLRDAKRKGLIVTRPGPGKHPLYPLADVRRLWPGKVDGTARQEKIAGSTVAKRDSHRDKA